MSDELCLLLGRGAGASPARRDVLGPGARHCAPGAHRARRSARQRDRDAHARAGAGGRRRGRSPARVGRRPAQAARTADRAQGSAGHRGRAHDVRLAVLPRPRARPPTPCRSSACARRARSWSARPTRPSGARARTRSTRSSARRATPGTRARSAGGSSGGGAVALACRMMPIADGSDLGGSLRNPPAWSGVLGLRPTPGLVPHGPSEAPWLPFAVEGPMARTAADLALLLGAMAGRRRARPALGSVQRVSTSTAPFADVSGRRVAWSPSLGGLPDRSRRARLAGGGAPVARCGRPRRERGRARSERRRRGVRDLAGVPLGHWPR